MHVSNSRTPSTPPRSRRPAYLPAKNPADVAAINAIVDKITVASSTGVTPSTMTTTFLCVLTDPTECPFGRAARPRRRPVPRLRTGPTGNVGRNRRVDAEQRRHADDSCLRPARGRPVQRRPGEHVADDRVPLRADHRRLRRLDRDVQSTACTGNCKSSGAPLDVALVLDRTGSMSPTDIQNTKDAAKELLKVYDPAQQLIALLALPYPGAADTCAVQSPQEYPAPDYTKWLVKGLSTDYSFDGTTLTGDLVDKIQCLARAHEPRRSDVAGNLSPNQAHTNLGDPMAAAGALLAATGRVGVPHVIIFMTDGQANQPTSCVTRSPRLRARTGIRPHSSTTRAATRPTRRTRHARRPRSTPSPTASRTFGAPTARATTAPPAPRATSPPVSSPTWRRNPRTTTRASTPGGCGPNENTDGDHYFCAQGHVERRRQQPRLRLPTDRAETRVRNGPPDRRAADADTRTARGRNPGEW